MIFYDFMSKFGSFFFIARSLRWIEELVDYRWNSRLPHPIHPRQTRLCIELTVAHHRQQLNFVVYPGLINNIVIKYPLKVVDSRLHMSKQENNSSVLQ